MHELCPPARDSKEAQIEVFRRAKREHGLSTSAIHEAYKPLKVGTMDDWAAGRAAMPAWAIGALGEAGVPDDILSLILTPFARHVGTNAADDGNLDALADEALEFGHEYSRARHPNSPGGVQIVPQETSVLVPLAGRLKAKARAA